VYVTENMIWAPADMIAIGDSHSDYYNDHLIFFGKRSLPARRHAKGANMVFCDGHVEWARQRDWVAKTPEARRRWNRDHEPHPETWEETRFGTEVVPAD
jgi:prepilin-type processing-associated H-X9-DG protein